MKRCEALWQTFFPESSVCGTLAVQIESESNVYASGLQVALHFQAHVNVWTVFSWLEGPPIHIPFLRPIKFAYATRILMHCLT